MFLHTSCFLPLQCSMDINKVAIYSFFLVFFVWCYFIMQLLAKDLVALWWTTYHSTLERAAKRKSKEKAKEIQSEFLRNM
jgi:hypothetical protein